MSATEL